jgi:hypothetical protein
MKIKNKAKGWMIIKVKIDHRSRELKHPTPILPSSGKKDLSLFYKDVGFLDPWIWGRHSGMEGFVSIITKKIHGLRKAMLLLSQKQAFLTRGRQYWEVWGRHQYIVSIDKNYMLNNRER